MDGPWQIGHKTADEYGRLAAEAGRAMRLVDPSIELVACGSSNSGMPTFGAWEQTVLGHAYDQVNYVSLHAYYQEEEGDVASFLASAVDMDYFIESVVSTVDAVRARGRHSSYVNLSFDEWNVWYERGQTTENQLSTIVASGQWPEHPRIADDQFNVTDAVVVGTMLNSLLRHGDRVSIANQAQLVNVIAPIRSEENGPAWRQSIFWPFARMAKLARGQILQTAVTSDRFDTAKYGGADIVDVSATWDEETRQVALFFANRGLDDATQVDVSLRGLSATRVVRAEVLEAPEGGDRFSSNTLETGEQVGLKPLEGVITDAAQISLSLPPLSWAVVVIQVDLV